MRFMLIVKADERSEAGVMPTEKELADMANFNEDMVKAGVMLAGDGLQASAKGARVQFKGGKPTVKDGPFTEAKEVIGGFAIYELPSKDEAVKLTREFLQMQSDIWPDWEGEVEIRQMWDDGPDSGDQS